MIFRTLNSLIHMIYFQFCPLCLRLKGAVRRTSLAMAVIVYLTGFVCTFETSAQDKVFKAGASTVNITPPLGSGIVGGFIVPPATHVHDDLHAKILVLDDGQHKLVFVVADNVGIHREVFDEAKRLIAAETGIGPGQVMMSSTHTHSAVSAGGEGDKRWGFNVDKPLDEYQSFIARRMA